MYKTKIVGGWELAELSTAMLNRAWRQGDKRVLDALALLEGDRVTCCDEAVVFVDDPLRGIATIAPRGEEESGEPTIVGTFVRLRSRGHGFGKKLLEVAVHRCLERGFDRIRVDVISHGGMAIVNSLPQELRSRLDIHDAIPRINIGERG